MGMERLGTEWQVLSDEVLTGRRDWRTAHPTARFAEIEAAVAERLNRMRVRMLEAARPPCWSVRPAGVRGAAVCPSAGHTGTDAEQPVAALGADHRG